MWLVCLLYLSTCYVHRAPIKNAEIREMEKNWKPGKAYVRVHIAPPTKAPDSYVLLNVNNSDLDLLRAAKPRADVTPAPSTPSPQPENTTTTAYVPELPPSGPYADFFSLFQGPLGKCFKAAFAAACFFSSWVAYRLITSLNYFLTFMRQ